MIAPGSLFKGRPQIMNEGPIRTAPLSRQDHLLRDKLIEDIAGQGARMDELACLVITLELAVPGLFSLICIGRTASRL